MSQIFWKDWASAFKIFLWILIFFAVLSILFFCFTYFSGYDLVISWRESAYFKQVDLLLDTINISPFNLTVTGDSLVILQKFEASPYQVNLPLNYILLFFLFFSFSILLAISTVLSRLWFLVSMGLWILILSSLRLEMLLFNGEPGYLPLIIIGGSTVALAYFFHDFGKNISFNLRTTSFTILFGLLFLVVHLFAEQQYPFLYLSSNAVIIVLLISILFILLIAHEIVAAFIYIITGSSTGGTNNHVHFIIITSIYLINLVLLYLYHINKIDWNIWYLNPYLLLIISALLGFWGFRQREEQYKHVLKFYPFGGYLYLALAIITFSTIGFFFGTVNDPAFEVIEEAIIYGHLSYGILFLIYILANFSGPLSRGLKVNKILYKPESMPYFTFRLAGLIGVFAFVIIGNWNIPFNYTFGTYFNQQGDYAQVLKKPVLKESYYHQSRIYAHLNHHANYSLADYYKERKQKGKASYYYLNAIEGDPSPQAYVSLSSIYGESNRFFDALFALQEGIGIVESGPLYNNLALLYAETEVIDSTFYFLEKATHFEESEDEAIANLEAFAAEHQLGAYLDSMEYKRDEEDIITLNNKIVRYNQQRKFYGAIPEVFTYPNADNFIASGLVYNFLLNTVFKEDTAGIKDIVNLTDKYSNSIYNERIRFGQSATEYYHHYTADAFRRLNLLANESYTENEKYFKVLGLWALEKNAPDQAALFFQMAKNKGASSVVWLQAFSLLEAGKPDSALQIISTARQDTINSFIIKEMALADPDGSEQEKLFYLKYHIPYYDTATFKNIIKTIENNDLRAEAILTFSKRLFDHDLVESSIEIFSLLTDLKLRNKHLFKQIQYFELQLLAAQGRLMTLANYINDNNIEFSFSRYTEKIFYAGMLNAISGDSIAALKNFRWIAENAPFHEMEVVKSTDYIRQYAEDPYEVYDLLLHAIEINPNAVRLLKAYIKEAIRLNLQDFANSALDDLQEQITTAHYQSFINELEGSRELVY